jgi:hypothetical protein
MKKSKNVMQIISMWDNNTSPGLKGTSPPGRFLWIGDSLESCIKQLLPSIGDSLKVDGTRLFYFAPSHTVQGPKGEF